MPAKVIDRTIKPFIRLLIDKISELNYRARDISLNTLMGLFRHPSVGIRHAIEGIMDITEVKPGVERAQWRLVSARLEILHQILKEFGINDKVWNWQVVYQKLVGPAFKNANPDVRLQAIECTLTFYQIVGASIRQEVSQIPEMKKTILDQVHRRMDMLDAEKGIKPAAAAKKQQRSPSPQKGKAGTGSGSTFSAKKRSQDLRKSLEQVQEEDEHREATPQQSRRGKK